MTKGIIFDVDGTLIHTSLDYVNETIKQVIQELDYGEYSPEKVHRFLWGDKKASRRELIETEFNVRFEDFIILFRKYTSDFNYAKQFKKLYNDVKPVLDELVKRSIPLGIVTDAPAYIASFQLNHFLGNGYFSQIIMTHELPDVKDKPEPDGLLLCMRNLGVDEAVFVGDSDSDMVAAQRAKIPGILLDRGEHETYVEPKRKIKNLYELL